MSQAYGCEEQFCNENAPSSYKFDFETTDDGDETSAYKNLDKPSPDQTRQDVHLTKPGHGKLKQPPLPKRIGNKNDSGRSPDQQKGSLFATTGDNAATSQGDDDAFYTKLEERLQQLTQRCDSMEKTIPRNQNMQNKQTNLIFSFVCIILIAIVVKSFFSNEEGNASSVPDSRLKKVEDHLRVIQDLPESLHNIKTQMGHIEGDVRSTKTQLEHIEGEVRSTKTQMGHIEGEVRRTTTQMGHFEGEVNSTKTQMGLIEGEVRSTRKHAEQLVATTNEDIRKGGEKIIQIRENLESLDHELNITTGKLNRTKEIQDIIHINTFDKVRTADECSSSSKWQNLKRESKAAVTSEKLERRKTGGGTLTAVADEQKVRIAEIYKDSASFNGILGGLDSDEADGRHFLSKTPVAPAVGTVQPTEQSSECCNKGPVKKQKKFSTKSEELQYWQVQYFKGEVEKQEREKQLLDIKIRMLLEEEKRRDQKVVDEFINGKFFED